jgi:hypothetical protein
MCSGNTVFKNAVNAHYLLPKPTLVDPESAWPTVTREGLLDVLKTSSDNSKYEIAALFAGELLPQSHLHHYFVRLILTKPEQSAEILDSGLGLDGMTDAFIEMGFSLLESGSTEERAVAVESVGVLSQNESLELVLRRGFSDPEEPVHAAARLVLFLRYRDLTITQANESVSRFISTIEMASKETRWVSIHHLERFSFQRDQILPFLESFIDTATVKIEKETALRVYNELKGNSGPIGR